MPESSSGDAPDKPRRRRAAGLDGMVLAELQHLASGLGITGTGRMRKSQLVDAIRMLERAGRSAADARSGAGTADRSRDRLGGRTQR